MKAASHSESRLSYNAQSASASHGHDQSMISWREQIWEDHPESKVEVGRLDFGQTHRGFPPNTVPCPSRLQSSILQEYSCPMGNRSSLADLVSCRVLIPC